MTVTVNNNEVVEVSEWRRGGRTAIAAALGYGTGPVLIGTTGSVFIVPAMEAFNAPSAQVVVGPLVSLIFALLGPVAGTVADRIGIKVSLIGGLVPYIASLVLLSVLPLSLPTYYIFCALIGLFGAFAFLPSWSRSIATWFNKSAGVAFGVVGVGGTLMPVIAIPLVTAAIYGWGFQQGYLVLAAFALFVSLPAAAFGLKTIKPASRTGAQSELSESPLTEPSPAAVVSTVDSRPSLTFREALRTPFFWLFTLTLFIVFLGVSAFVSNLQPILLNKGFTVEIATAITATSVTGAAAGRLFGGLLLDKLKNWAYVGVLICLLSIIGALGVLLLDSSDPFIIILISTFLVASAQGGEADVANYVILKKFGPKSFGGIIGAAYMGVSIGGVVGALGAAQLRDMTGNYTLPSAIGAGCFALGAIAFLLFALTNRRTIRQDTLRTLNATPDLANADLRDRTNS